MNKLITGRTHYYAPAANIVMVVTINGAPDQEQIEAALVKALSKHEIFSNKIILDNNGDSYYQATLPRAIDLKVREFHDNDDWKQLIREQERVPFDFIHGELIRFFLLKNDGMMKLVIISNHLAGDGLSMIYLIRDIMAALANPQIEYDTHPMRLMEDFGYPKNSKLQFFMRFAQTQVNKSWNKNKKIFKYEEYLAMFNSFWKNRELEVLDDTITGTHLNSLIQKCKEYHVTINSVIATAFLTATRGEKELGMAVNVRPKGHEGMGNYVSGMSLQFEPSNKKSFWQNVIVLNKIIHKRLRDNGDKYFVLQFLKGMEPTLIDATYFAVFAGLRNKAARKAADWFGYYDNQISIGISNLARMRIPSTYGKYTIDKIDFVPPLLTNNKLVIGVITVDGKMSFTMQYKKEKDSDLGYIFKDALSILRLESDL